MRDDAQRECACQHKLTPPLLPCAQGAAAKKQKDHQKLRAEKDQDVAALRAEFFTSMDAMEKQNSKKFNFVFGKGVDETMARGAPVPPRALATGPGARVQRQRAGRPALTRRRAAGRPALPPGA